MVSFLQNPKNRGLCHETYSTHSFSGPAAVAAGHRPVSNAPCLREKDGVDSSTAIQEAAPSEAAPSEAAPSEAAPSDSAVAAPAAVSGSIDTDDFPLTDGQQQALHRYMAAYYTTLGDLTEPNTDGVFCADDIAAYEQAVGNDPSQSRPGMILCILGWK